MTYSETKFRQYLKKVFTDPNTYIKKVADMKQGTIGNKGLPDYLVISEGNTIWFEVKMSPTKTTFPLNLISDVQIIEFTKIMNAGGKIFIAIYIGKELYMIDFKNIQLRKIVGQDKSISVEQLEQWRFKW